MSYKNNLIALKNDLKIYIEKHSSKSKMYSYIYNGIMYTSIFIGLFVGFSLSTLGIDKNKLHFQIPVAILSFINSLIISIIKFKNFEEISITHTKATKEYFALYKAITNQLLNEGEDYRVFTAWAFQKYDTIYQSSPFVINKQLYDDHNLSYENVVSNICGSNISPTNSNENNTNSKNNSVNNSIVISLDDDNNITSGSTQMIQYELRRLRSNANM